MRDVVLCAVPEMLCEILLICGDDMWNVLHIAIASRTSSHHSTTSVLHCIIPHQTLTISDADSKPHHIPRHTTIPHHITHFISHQHRSQHTIPLCITIFQTSPLISATLCITPHLALHPILHYVHITPHFRSHHILATFASHHH